MAEVPEVSKHEFSIAYSGQGRRDDHSISVDALAPALLAFGKLMREANTELNGRKSKSNVYVVSDFEHKCFNVNFELVVSLYDQLKSLLALGEVKDAKEILEWLGILSGVILPSGGLLGYLKWKKGRKTIEARDFKDEDGNGVVTVRVEGESNSITVHNHIYNMSTNPRAMRATRDAFLPIGQDGFDSIEVREGDRLVNTISPSEVEDIVASCTTAIGESKEIDADIDVTTAWLSVYSPVYDERAGQWRFRLGTDVIYADISETSIARDALERGGALTDDTYQVTLQITVDVDEKGKRAKPRYKVLDVIKFVAAEPRSRQLNLLSSDEDEPPSQVGNAGGGGGDDPD